MNPPFLARICFAKRAESQGNHLAAIRHLDEAEELTIDPDIHRQLREWKARLSKEKATMDAKPKRRKNASGS